MKLFFLRWAAVLLVAVVVTIVGMGTIIQASLDAQRSRLRPPFLHVVADLLWDTTDGVPDDELPAVLARYGEVVRADVVLLDLDDASIPAPIRMRLDEGEPGFDGTREGARIFIPLHDRPRVALVGPVHASIDPDPRDVTKLIGFTLVVVALAAALPVIPLARRLRRLDRATRAVGEGRTSTRVAVGGKDALGSLEHHFNAMADRVEELLAGQRQLLQVVAHEIRTPIARIQFQREMIALAGDDDERTRREGELDEELEELDTLVGELLVFTRHDDDVSRLLTEPVDVADVIEQQVRRSAERYPEIRVTLEGLDGEVELQAHPRSFARVVHNLVANALRYAREDVVVRVTHQPGGDLLLEVEDDGPGIPEADRERVFEPFSRVDDSRDRKTGGVGLGLAIVQRIVTAHGGTIEAGESGGGGSRLITRWPGGSDPRG